MEQQRIPHEVVVTHKTSNVEFWFAYFGGLATGVCAALAYVNLFPG